MQYESGGEKITIDVDVAAGATEAIGYGDGGQLFLADIDTQPGGLLAVYFQYGDVQGRQLLVPVLDGTLEEYAPFVPTPTPTPTPTETAATPTPTSDAVARRLAHPLGLEAVPETPHGHEPRRLRRDSARSSSGCA